MLSPPENYVPAIIPPSLQLAADIVMPPDDLGPGEKVPSFSPIYGKPVVSTCEGNMDSPKQDVSPIISEGPASRKPVNPSCEGEMVFPFMDVPPDYSEVPTKNPQANIRLNAPPVSENVSPVSTPRFLCDQPIASDSSKLDAADESLIGIETPYLSLIHISEPTRRS